MRLPVTPSLSTKDGTANRNARLTNMLKESSKAGDLAVVRPGLVASDSYSGVGSGLIPFDGRLLVIYDDTVYDTELTDSMPWPLDALPWDAGTTYAVGDTIFCSGVLKFSMTNGNIGNACDAAGTTYWAYSHDLDTYVPTESYDVGDTVVVDGVTYYSLAPSNTGNAPASSPYHWSTTPTTTARWQGTFTGASGPGGECGSIEAAGYSAWLVYPYRSCATKFSGTNTYVTFAGMVGLTMRGNQWSDPTPSNCTAAQSNLGIVNKGTLTQTHA